MNSTVIGLLIGLGLAVVTILLILLGRGKERSIDVSGEDGPVLVTSPDQVTPAAARMDDLNIVEGIGPKIAGLLQQHGISTFAQLAATDPAVLEKLLRENGMPYVKPQSWPEQARLAAEGKMAELKALQDRLVAGR